MKRVLIILLALVSKTLSLPFFLPDHDFMPPTEYSIYNGLNISSQRGPCPGLNTLANHGYINRNGRDITFESIENAAAIAYGYPKEVVHDIIAIIYAIGLKHVGENEQGKKTINLFDLYDGPLLDGTSVRHDAYFQKYAQFNETLFQRLIANKNDGAITFDQTVDHAANRIIDSRTRNTEFSLPFSDPTLASTVYGTFAFALLTLGDYDTFSIRTDYLRIFLEENRIPDDYVPVFQEHYVSMSSKQVEEATPKLKHAFEVTIDGLPRDSDSPQVGLTVGLVLGGIAVVTMLLLGGYFITQKQSEMGSAPIDYSISDRPVFSVRNSLVGNKVLPKDLAWENITVTTKEKETLVSNLTGRAPSGQVTGLIGHSGSGKTTLLRMLQGKAKSLQARKMSVEGSIFVNGEEIVKQTTLSMSQHIAFVAQEDVFVETATPKEAIRFAARMRLPKSKSDLYVDDISELILCDLRLKHVQDRVMGDKNGLSGGEKRRVSFGLALVTRPSILLLDEITSGMFPYLLSNLGLMKISLSPVNYTTGLDSYGASEIVDICNHLAHVRGTAVLMSMHQPSKQMMSKIDRIVLLRSGKCMFELPTNDVETKFLDAGYPVPEEFTIVDWALEVSQQRSFAELKDSGFFGEDRSTSGILSEKRVPHNDPLVDFNETPIKGNTDRTLDSVSQRSEISENQEEKHERISFVSEVKRLAVRGTQYIMRSWKVQATKFAVTMALSSLFIFFAWQLGPEALDNPENFSAQVGVVFLTVEASSVVLLLEGHEIAVERLTFVREYSTGHYRLISYALVKIVFGALLMWPLYLSGFVCIFLTVGLQGRFWYSAAVSWLFLAVNSALGHVVAGIPKNPFDAQVLASLVLFPQVTLCGFLVSYNAMPEWSRWVLWINPMTYAFRLGLGEVFRKCTEFTREEQEVVNCADAVYNAFGNGNSSIQSIYDDDSVLNVVQAGTYKGRDAILEYFGYLSFDGVNRPLAGLHDMCAHKDTMVARLNGAEGGVCDISVADTSSAKLNPSLHKDKESLFVKFIFGHRILFDYSNDLSLVHIKSEAAYFPKNVLKEALDHTSQSAMAAATCISFENSCPTEFEANGFKDVLECIHRMTDDIPMYTTSEETGLVVIDANSTGCRHLHASLAVVSPEDHCPHVSFIPMEDPNGATKCNNGYDLPYEDFFDKNDIALFEQAAIKGGLDVNTKLSVSSKGEDRENCSPSVLDSAADIAFESDLLPNHFLCYRYLSTQWATGEQQTEYWLALVGFFFLFRLMGFGLFWKKASLQ